MKKAFLVCVVALFSWLLSSCFIPENFKAYVTLHKDGTYTFTYEGILTYATARAAYVKKQLSAKDEAEIKKLEKELAKDSSFKKVAYLGAGQFKVAYEKQGKITTPFYFMGKDSGFFSIRRIKGKNKDDLAEIKGFQAGEKERRELKEIDVKINGELKVETNGRVIKHNAKSTPGLFGLLSGYKWDIKSAADPAPYMLVNLE